EAEVQPRRVVGHAKRPLYSHASSGSSREEVTLPLPVAQPLQQGPVPSGRNPASGRRPSVIGTPSRQTCPRPILMQSDSQSVENVSFNTFAHVFAPEKLEIGLPRLRMSWTFLQDLPKAVC
ncbi:unnamed protein product, partial [Laminaria digitata]